MSAQLRVLRRRVRSTRNIAQITRAMEMVATARITKAQHRVENSRPYADAFNHVMTQAADGAATDHPLLVGRESPQRAGVLVITSDRGLAGGYNASVYRAVARLENRLREAGKEPVLFLIGGKGVGYYRFRGREAARSWTGFSELPGYENATEVGDVLGAAFMAGGDSEVSAEQGEDSDRPGTLTVPTEAEGVLGVDELHMVYTEFTSMLSHSAVPRQIAPLLSGEQDSSDGESSRGQGAEYEFEPESHELFDVLLPKYIRTRVFAALLDSAASESAARRTAMKAATDNANELIENLTREANQARQAQITQEISEIVGGSDALASAGE